MRYRVKLAPRAEADLAKIYEHIKASHSQHAQTWFTGLEQALYSLDTSPVRGFATAEDPSLRHLLYGHGKHRYRVIYWANEHDREVEVLHIRHGARDAFTADDLEPD